MEGSRRPGRNETTRRAPTLSLTPLVIAALASAIVLLGAGSSYAAKPTPKLTSTLCAALGGTWTVGTCTVAAPATATSSFVIPDGSSLVVAGTAVDSMGCVLSIASGVTVTVAANGTMAVTNATIKDAYGYGIGFGICNFGTLANLGTLDVRNSGDGSAGLVNVGAITNAGAVTIANTGANSWGIANILQPDESVANGSGSILATLANTGTISISNTGDSSMGLLNGGAVTNSGALTVADTLGATATGFEQDGGTFTNEASGTLTNDGGTYDPATGLGTQGFYNNGGTMINLGTANNKGAMVTWGWVMLTYGTINNYGLVYQADGELVNYGTVHNYGTIGARSGAPDYPHNRGICINETLNGVTGTGC